MNKIIILLLTGFSSLAASSYDDFMEELTPDLRTYMTEPKQGKTQKSSTYTNKSVADKEIKEVKQSNKALVAEVKEIKHQVNKIEKTVKTSNETLVKEVKESNQALVKEVKQSNYSMKHQGKGVIPVAMINEPTPTTRNSFLTIGFGMQGLTVEADNGYFSENALDDSAIDIRAGYGQYFTINETKLFATGGFEYLALKQADMKAITASINTETTIDKYVTAYIGIKAGLSYLVWDIQQDEAIESITSTSPLVGIQAGIEYKFTDSLSLVLGGEYTKYFHETQIPNDTLKTNSAYGVNISLKFYQ